MVNKKVLNKIKANKYKTKESLTLAKNSYYRRVLKEKATKPELIFKKFLENMGIRFIFQKGFVKPFHRIVDFYIPELSLIIEIDGDYHNTPETHKKDINKDYCWLKDRNMQTIRVMNEEIYNGSYISKFKYLIEYANKRYNTKLPDKKGYKTKKNKRKG